MKKKLKVNEALAVGRKMIIFPVTFVVLGSSAVLGFFIAQSDLPVWALSLGVVLSLMLGWICWRVMVIWWKSWAFPNVKNIYQLKKRTSQEKLLWPSVGFFAKPRPEFEKPGDFVLSEESNIPKEITIYYSKRKKFGEMINPILGFILILIFGFKNDTYGIPIVIAGIFFFVAYYEYKKATSVTPQIVINNKGIWTIQGGFRDWAEINFESIVTTNIGKTTINELVYHHSGGSEFINIDEYNIAPLDLGILLEVYRKRHQEMQAKRR